VRAGEHEAKGNTSSTAVLMLPSMDPPPEGKPTFPTSTQRWGEGVAGTEHCERDGRAPFSRDRRLKGRQRAKVVKAVSRVSGLRVQRLFSASSTVPKLNHVGPLPTCGNVVCSVRGLRTLPALRRMRAGITPSRQMSSGRRRTSHTTTGSGDTESTWLIRNECS